jgi:DUF1707 SHOCT-like domain
MSKRSSQAAGGSSRRRGYANPGLRVSDAERAEVADHLSRNYGEGRLSQAEFEERLDRAMRATTWADLSGLTADLPGTDTAGAALRRRPGRRPHHILAPLLVILLIVTAWPALAWSYHLLPWLLIGLLAFLWLRHGRRRHSHLP